MANKQSSELTFNDYQLRTRETAVYPNVGNNFIYPALGLAGETGEVMEHIKKAVRDDNGLMTPERLQKLRGELGDVMYYLARIADEVGLTMADVAMFNLNKLSERKAKGTLHGSGSER